ncbi:MAG: hypothetical protein K6B43_05485 [Treponema sp.]|nr:hypothetical protein [Treponema sp.]
MRKFVYGFFAVAFTVVLGMMIFNSRADFQRAVSAEPAVVYPPKQEISNALDKSYVIAQEYASEELDKWIETMMARLDDGFLDDYFGFFRTKGRELASVWASVKHFFDENSETAEEVLARELEEEICRNVIMPEISQAEIERISRESLDLFLDSFDSELERLQQQYNVPVLDWNRYICDITGLTMDTRTRSVPIKMKAAFTGLAFASISSVPLLKMIVPRVSQKIAAKTGSKIAGKIAVKAAGKSVAKGAAGAARAIPYVGLGIAVAIGIWDIFDYAKTSAEGKRLLKQSLQDYFGEVKAEMLSGSEESVMGSLVLWENDLKKNIYEKNGV